MGFEAAASRFLKNGNLGNLPWLPPGGGNFSENPDFSGTIAQDSFLVGLFCSWEQPTSAIPALDAFMQRNTLLIVMVAAGSAMCWWPKIIPPNLDLPGWKTPLILIALVTGLGTALSDDGAGWFMSASILGVFAWICCGFRLWWSTDYNDASYGFIISLATLVSIPVSVIAVAAGVALRESKIAQKNRRLIWCAYLSSYAFAPTVVALTPLLVILRK